MSEFTLKIYELILKSFASQGYDFSTYEQFITNNNKRAVILRHDVDRLPTNSLRMAELENRLAIKASYYFRVVDPVYDESIIEKIVGFGHEVSYHYEDLSLCRGNYDLAIKSFDLNLRKFREFYPVKTICMHGSPMSKYDNKKIWEKYDYRDYGIIAEPYFDINFNEVFYITDTGRSWNDSTASIRDKVNSKYNITIKDTYHLIDKIKNNELPDKIMINVHPHRWFNYGYNWYKELFMQNFKNQFKSLIVRLKDK